MRLGAGVKLGVEAGNGIHHVRAISGRSEAFFAAQIMAAAVIGTRLQLAADIGPSLRLANLSRWAHSVFAVAIAFLDRRLVSDFLEFVRTAFEWKRRSTTLVKL